MSINLYNKEKGTWTQASSLLAKNHQLIDAEGYYQATNVEDAFKEVGHELDIIKNDVQYIYENGTIGGGGGGGGSSLPQVTTSFKKTNVTSQEIISIPYYFNSPNIGKGKAQGWLNGVKIYEATADIGINTWTFTEPLAKGQHKIELYVIDAATLHSNVLTIELSCGELEIEYKGSQLLTFIVGSKIEITYVVSSVSLDPITVEYCINGVAQAKVNSGKGQRTWEVGSLPKGQHLLTVQAFTGEKASNILSYTVAVIESDELYIGTDFDQTEIAEGVPLTVSFITSLKGQAEVDIDTYIDNVFQKTLRVPIGIGAWSVGKLLRKELDAPYELKLIAKTIDRDKESAPLIISIAVTQNAYTTYAPYTENLIAWFDGASTTNSDASRNIWKNEVTGSLVTCQLYDLNYSTNGYLEVKDNSEDQWTENGVTTYNKAVYFTGESYGIIDYAPFAENCPDGLTIDMSIQSTNIGNLDAFAFYCCHANNDRGIYVNTYSANIETVDIKKNVNIGEGQWMRLTFTIDWLSNTAMLYIDAVPSGVIKLDANQKYTHDRKIYLNCGIDQEGNRYNFGKCAFKNIRIYNKALEFNQILQNHIADMFNKDVQRTKAVNNDTQLLPVLKMKGRLSALGSTEKPTVGEFYIEYLPRDGGGGFQKYRCRTEYQGTSSMQYKELGVPNYTFKVMQYGVAGDEGEGVPDYITVRDGWLPEYIYTLKADFMESSHANNVGTANFIYQFMNLNPPPTAAYPGQNRSTIDGFPVLVQLFDEDKDEQYHDIGVYMFNLDRYASNNFGLTMSQGTCLSYEGAKNSNTGAVAFNDYSDEVISAEWDLRFPMGTELSTHPQLSALIKWVKESADQDFGDDETFEMHLSLQHCIDYYLMVYVFGMIDNLGKNMRLNTWDGVKWYPAFYDLD